MNTRTILSSVAALLLALSLGAPHALAGDKMPAARADKKPAEEVTLSGDMVCGKCNLKETKACQNVLKVTENGKETKYYLAKNDVAESNHGTVCSGSAKATVTGTVKTEAKKKVLTASAIKYAE